MMVNLTPEIRTAMKRPSGRGISYLTSGPSPVSAVKNTPARQDLFKTVNRKFELLK